MAGSGEYPDRRRISTCYRRRNIGMTKISRRATSARRGMGKGSGSDQAGFTVIELAIVLVILGVVVAIGVPTYFTLRHERSDPAAQTSLEQALNIADGFYKNNAQTYVNICPTKKCGQSEKKGQQPDGYMAILASGAAGPSAVTNPQPSTGTSVVSIDVVNRGADIIIAALADGTGNCWAVIEATAPGLPLDGLGANFVGVANAVDPVSKIGRAKCSAGLFDNSNVIGSKPIFNRHAPPTPGAKIQGFEPVEWPHT